ncbi:stonustoxin subunit alpha-like [Ctenopharyngodon idella]|uniref:stonustoxin subunit alpha-like n=1 Tax=Ctenopharyngodon idella TaxID=7959 RepID=UPI00222FFF2E|nr:stonustoxin subunit alpha-like [Ctenopharyngodon idella]
MASEPMEVAALGRPLSLGMLYDCRKDSFIPGVTLWDEKSLSENLHNHPQPRTDLKFSSSDSLSSKSSLLDISASLKASFMGGLVEVEGSGKFLRDTKSSNQQSRVTMFYSETTRFEQLTMSQLGQITYPQVFDQKTATHVVTAVLYGAQAVMVFDRSISEEESKQEIEGKLNVMVKSIPEFSIKGKGSVNMKDDEKKMSEKISCTFHGDFLIEQNPTTYMEAIQTYKTLPTLLKENPQNVVPIKVWLYPLHLLDDKAAQLQREITTSLISDTEHIFEELGEAERTCNDLFKNTLVNAFSDIKERLQLFQDSLSTYKIMLLEAVHRVLPAIRGGEEEEKSLEDILNMHRSSPFSADKLNKWLNDAKSELRILSSYTNRLQGINIVGSADLITIFFDPDVDKVVCLTFTSLKYEDPYLSTLKEFPKSDMSKELDASKPFSVKSVKKWVNGHSETDTGFSTMRFIEHSAHSEHSVTGISVNSFTKWFKDLNIIIKMRQNLSQFRRFAEANKDEKRTRCIISAISNPFIAGSSINQYEKGKLTDREFQPTFKPPPTIAEPAIVGGTGGDEFSFKSALYNAFQKITITYNQNAFFTSNRVTSLNTIQVIFQDFQMIKVGRVAGNKEKVFLFDITDKIVNATLWPNRDGTRFGGLEFVVEKNDGERITMSIKRADLGEPVIVNVGSGKCYGIKGRSGDEIDALGFYCS